MPHPKHRLRPLPGAVVACAVSLSLLGAPGCAQGGADDMAGPWGEDSGGTADATTDALGPDARGGLSTIDALPAEGDPPLGDDGDASPGSVDGTAPDDAASLEDEAGGDAGPAPAAEASTGGGDDAAADASAVIDASTAIDTGTVMDATTVVDAGAVMDAGSDRGDASGHDAQTESGTAGDSSAPGDAGVDANATCSPAYSNAACLTYVKGQQVSNAGHNWRCADLNCENCATYPNCGPGAPVTPACPWGAVWTDEGACP